MKRIDNPSSFVMDISINEVNPTNGGLASEGNFMVDNFDNNSKMAIMVSVDVKVLETVNIDHIEIA